MKLSFDKREVARQDGHITDKETVMPNKKRSKKKTTAELIKAIREALEGKNYYFTDHATDRSKQRRNVNKFQVVRILRSKSKYHEPKKDTYSDRFETWNYSLRGMSVDEDVRIILSFDENDMLILTVINLEE